MKTLNFKTNINFNGYIAKAISALNDLTGIQTKLINHNPITHVFEIYLIVTANTNKCFDILLLLFF